MTKRLGTYRYLRDCGLSRHSAAWSALAPTRLRVAVHAVKGHPVIYGMTFRHTIHLTEDHTDFFMADCRLIGDQS